jgi:hypothetical protein
MTASKRTKRSTQFSLFPRGGPVRDLPPLRDRFAQSNRHAAHLILSDPRRYGGEESLMVRWAHMVIHGYQSTPQQWSLSA